jgi:hypothetical protein
MNRKLKLFMLLSCFAFITISSCVSCASAQSGDWTISDDWNPNIFPTPSPPPDRSETTLITTFEIIYVAVPLLALIVLALIGSGVIKMDDSTILLAIVTACIIAIGLTVALYIMSTVTVIGIV